LAIHRREFLPFHVPDIGQAEIASVLETLSSGWLTTGPKVRAFEEAFSGYTGARHTVAMDSCTAALHLALEACGIGPGDEVLVPTMTFGATGEVVIHVGARPVLVDCRPDNLNIDVGAAEQLITHKTKAIIPVYYGGHACDMDALLVLARRYRLIVIEDAAHALPTTYKGARVSSIGDVTCFSFYATKTITTGEGGMATTAQVDLAERIRMLSLHGISKNAWQRYTAEGSWYYEIIRPGFKYNIPDLAAALGLAQLARCDFLHHARCRYAAIYRKELSRLPEISLPQIQKLEDDAWHLYPIQLTLICYESHVIRLFVS
jgi:dTDP-4-amino-4,6-dideoxygalactose transaminase